MVAKKFIYRGIYHQRGQGIASLLGSLFRTMVPALSGGVKALARSPSLRRAVKTVGKEAIKTGLTAVSQASKGKKIGPAVSAQINRAKKRIAEAALGEGSECTSKKKPRRLQKTKKKARSIDIFS